jgi:hypothetical protein
MEALTSDDDTILLSTEGAVKAIPDEEKIEIWPLQQCGCEAAAHRDHHDVQTFTDLLNRVTPDLLVANRHYDKVVALFIYWQQSDVEELQARAEDLRNVLTTEYRYDTRTHILKNADETAPQVRRNLTRELNSVVSDVSDGSGQNLLIIYYAGHGTRSGANRGWEPTKPTGSPKVSINWSSHQERIKEECDADVLFLFECCYAGSMIVDNEASPYRWQRCCELLGASGVLERVPVRRDGSGSFTTALQNELHSLRNSGGVAVADVHARLHRSAPESLGTTPDFLKLTERNYNFHISLAPLASSTDTASDDTPELDSNATSTASDLGDNFTQTDHFSEPEMLIAVKFTDLAQGFVLDQYTRWIRSTPHTISSLKFIPVEKMVTWHAAFKSNSMLAVISMPLWLWDAIPKDAATSPLGIVYSRNILETERLAGQRALSQVPESVPQTKTRRQTPSPPPIIQRPRNISPLLPSYEPEDPHAMEETTTEAPAARQDGDTSSPLRLLFWDMWFFVIASLSISVTSPLGRIILPLISTTKTGELFPTASNMFGLMWNVTLTLLTATAMPVVVIGLPIIFARSLLALLLLVVGLISCAFIFSSAAPSGSSMMSIGNLSTQKTLIPEDTHSRLSLNAEEYWLFIPSLCCG